MDGFSFSFFSFLSFLSFLFFLFFLFFSFLFFSFSLWDQNYGIARKLFEVMEGMFDWETDAHMT